VTFIILQIAQLFTIFCASDVKADFRYLVGMSLVTHHPIVATMLKTGANAT